MASTGFGAAYRQIRDLFGTGSVVGLGDGQLLARYSSSKDEAAFEALVSRHGPMVLATCRAVLRNEHDIEDAFQATFLVLARKAHSVRGGDALGGWLHQVAYRASVQASVEARRRRLKETEASAAARRISARTDPDPELAAILHEEINRLPESLRLPLILCDLEGLTAEQAARHLRSTEPTVRHRLARGRQKLKGRLTRRGLMVPAIGALLASKASAAVSLCLARVTLAAATGGPVSTGAAILTHTLLRGMLMTKLKIAATAALAALALGSGGYYAAGAGRPDEPKPAMKPAVQAQAQATEPKALKSASKPGETFEIGGIVLDPGGKPVAGAKVWLEQSFGKIEPTPEAEAGADGRFAIRIPRSIRDGFPERVVARYPRLIATAPGFAPGWVGGIFRPDAVPTGWGITLAEAGPPIEGRVLDLEGRPVAGVRVESKDLWYLESGNLSNWVESARAGGIQGIQGIWRELQNLSIEPATISTTTPDGRFRIEGPGRDRVAALLITGPTIATETVYVMGSDLPELRTVDKSWPEPRPFVNHAPRFDHAAAPSRPIEGVARDKDTGKPVAGIRIRANIDREGDHTMIDGIEATTDAEGRYRLTGLPRASGYRIFTFPKAGTPYTNGSFVVPATSTSLGSVPFEIAMKRGIVVRGRVTDKATGLPVKASVDTFVFADNPYFREFPGYNEGYQTNAQVQDDGRFEVVTLPGRGIIAVRAADDILYLGGVGAETIQGRQKTATGSPSDFETRPQSLNSKYYHALAGLDLDPAVESAKIDLQLDPGRSLSITALDPDGQPVGGNRVAGLGDNYHVLIEQTSATFDVRSLNPSRPRRVTILNGKHHLVGTVYLKGDESGERTVRLQPWGGVTGRVVNEEGQPLPGTTIFNPGGIPDEPSQDRAMLPGRDSVNGNITTDADGRFRIEGLIPGLKYGGYVADGSKGLGDLFQDVVVAPGEVKDLGDLKAQPDRR